MPYRPALPASPATSSAARRLRLAFALAAALLGAAPAVAAQPTPTAKPEGRAPTTDGKGVRDKEAIAVPPGFDAWRDRFRATARAAGISNRIYDDALSGVTPDPKVLERNAYQPEFTRPIWQYLDGAVSKTRIANGRKKLQQHQALLGRVERTYGVPAKVIVAIWGLETSYGAIMGSMDIVRSLATLAYAGRRQTFGQRELINALKIIQAGDKSRTGLKGSWAGAMGHTQFIPSSFLAYAVDFDGDGRRDIWDSLPDVFASTANFLKKANWDAEYRWGREVTLPAGFDYALAGRDTRYDLERWARLGVRRPGGGTLPLAPITASLIVPAGHQGPAFLVYRNFGAIMRYNPATAYALGIGHLSDRIAGAGPFQGSWPRETKILSRDQRKEMQQRLNQLGYNAGTVDGILGAQTRAALRRFQTDSTLIPDGFATEDVLDRLREAVRRKSP